MGGLCSSEMNVIEKKTEISGKLPDHHQNNKPLSNKQSNTHEINKDDNTYDNRNKQNNKFGKNNPNDFTNNTLNNNNTKNHFKNLKDNTNNTNNIYNNQNDRTYQNNINNFNQFNRITEEIQQNYSNSNYTKSKQIFGTNNTYFDTTFYEDKNIEILGEGSFGVVVKEIINYKDENGDKRIVAAKYLKSRNLIGQTKKNFLRNLFKETGLMVNLFHKNIIKLISIHTSQTKLLMDYLEGGSLDNVIYKENGNKNTSLYFKIHCLFEICDGLQFLHKREIIHGDLKSKNILLDKQYKYDENFPNLKLADFGISAIKEDICPNFTVGFAAPELYQKKKRTIKSDIYSFGVVIYEIFKGESPNLKRLSETSKNPNIFYSLPDISHENWPKEIKNIINKCCVQNNDKRPSIDEIKNELSEYCKNSRDNKLIALNEKMKKNVNFDIADINQFICQLFIEIKSIASKQYKDFIYLKDNIPLNGFGKYKFEDGTIYIGWFKEGRINQYGKFIYPNKIIYQGQHFQGVWNGYGIFKYTMYNMKYEGSFKMFQFDDFGIISLILPKKGKLETKFEYIGDFKNGIQNGIGEYIDDKFRTYSGEFKNGNFGGIGKFIYPDGETCEGEFDKGKREGFCIIKYADNSSYEGHFKDSRFNGYGKFIIRPGEIYEGNWENGYPIEMDKFNF